MGLEIIPRNVGSALGNDGVVRSNDAMDQRQLWSNMLGMEECCEVHITLHVRGKRSCSEVWNGNT